MFEETSKNLQWSKQTAKFSQEFEIPTWRVGINWVTLLRMTLMVCWGQWEFRGSEIREPCGEFENPARPQLSIIMGHLSSLVHWLIKQVRVEHLQTSVNMQEYFIFFSFHVSASLSHYQKAAARTCAVIETRMLPAFSPLSDKELLWTPVK